MQLVCNAISLSSVSLHQLPISSVERWPGARPILYISCFFYILSHNSLCSFIPTSAVPFCTSRFYRPSCSQQFSHVLFCTNFVNLQPLLSCLSSSSTVDRSVDEIRKCHRHILCSPVDYPNHSILCRTT